MDRITGTNTVDLGGGRRGFRSKDTVSGVPGTIVTAGWLNGSQEELLGLVEATGQTPSAANLTQVTRAVRSQQLNRMTAGGTANAITLTPVPPSPAFASLADLAFVPLRFLVTATNTGAVTINVSGLGARTAVNPGGAALQGGELVAGAIITAFYDGTNFQITSGTIQRNYVAVFNTAGTFTFVVPAGVYAIWGDCWGGGGGGCGFSPAPNTEGEAGGGGGYAGGWMSVTPGQSITIIVGSAGGSGNNAVNGTPGGTSSIGAFMSSTGGGGGTIAGLPGLGGVGTGGQINLAGASGEDGYLTFRPYAAGGDAGGWGGKGAKSIIPGQWPGGGGMAFGNGSLLFATNGAPGGVILRY